MNILSFLFKRPQPQHMERVRIASGRYARLVKIYRGKTLVSSYYEDSTPLAIKSHKIKNSVFLSDITGITP